MNHERSGPSAYAGHRHRYARAAELVIGETTVKTHVARMMMKLGVHDRVQAVVLAYELGSLPPAAAREDRERGTRPWQAVRPYNLFNSEVFPELLIRVYDRPDMFRRAMVGS